MTNIFICESDQNINDINGSILVDADNCLVKYAGSTRRINETPGIEFLTKNEIDAEFLNFVDELGNASKSKYWWATLLAEKNYFASRLYPRLFLLYHIDLLISSKLFNNIYIVSKDIVLNRQLVRNFKDNPATHYSRTAFSLFAITCFLKRTKAYFSIFFNALSEFKNALQARQKLAGRYTDINSKQNVTIVKTILDWRNYRTSTFKDSYFGILPKYLKSQNKNLMYFAAITDTYEKTLAQLSKDTENNIIPLNYFVCFTDILKSAFLSVFLMPAPKRSVFKGLDAQLICNDEILLDLKTGHFFTALIHYFSCIRLAKAVNIQNFIYTFENYAWEKMCIQALRETSPHTMITGFQHSFIARNSFLYFNAKNDTANMPLPDKIVTLGDITKSILSELGNIPKSILFTGCALRQEYLFKLQPLRRNRNKNMFVALTITAEDSIKVFKFIYDSGLANSDYNFYFRFHPATPRSYVLDNVGFALPDNFIISDNPPMPEEIERSSVVLYTWTTVSLEALKLGRPVIYLDVNYPLEVDPLFQCQYLKKACAEPDKLKDNIDYFERLSDNIFNNELNLAQAYLNSYFSPVNEQNLKVFLN